MQIRCPTCRSTLAFPDDALVVLCPNCEQKFNPADLPNRNYRGWLITLIGLILIFSFWLTVPLIKLVDDSTSVTLGVFFLHIILGTPVVIAGLLISISDKIRRGSKWIILELILGIYIISGFLSLTSMNGIV